jgi:hypothetical protein
MQFDCISLEAKDAYFDQDCFDHLGSLCFHINLGIIFSFFVKNVSGILIGIALNLYNNKMLAS